VDLWIPVKPVKVDHIVAGGDSGTAGSAITLVAAMHIAEPYSPQTELQTNERFQFSSRARRFEVDKPDGRP
jgi:hypothetical protein